MSLKGSGRFKECTARRSTHPASGRANPEATAAAFLKADIDEKIYIEIPEEYKAFPGAVGRLDTSIYERVRGGRQPGEYLGAVFFSVSTYY